MKIASLSRAAGALLCAAALLSTTLPGAAKPKVDRARAEAERACYLDAKTLCPEAMPDEDKITACFTAKRAQLSPACGAIFDKGI